MTLHTPAPTTLPDHRLLEPGWPGLLTYDEGRFIQARLWSDPKLRRSWRIKGKKPNLMKIAERAYPEDPEAARANMVKEQGKARRRTGRISQD